MALVMRPVPRPPISRPSNNVCALHPKSSQEMPSIRKQDASIIDFFLPMPSFFFAIQLLHILKISNVYVIFTTKIARKKGTAHGCYEIRCK